MKNRDYLDTTELTDQQLTDLMNLALALKTGVKADFFPQLIRNRTVGLLLEDADRLTTLAYENAVLQLGGFPQRIDGFPLEPAALRTTLRSLTRLCDCLIVRTERHETLLSMGKLSEIPVMNAGSGYCEPVQELADLITMYEHLPKEKRLEECRVVFEGPLSPACTSTLFLTTKIGMPFVQLADKSGHLTPPLLKIAERNVKKSGGTYLTTESKLEALRDAEFLRTESDAPTAFHVPDERPHPVDPTENRLTAIRALLVFLLYQDPARRDSMLAEKLRRTLSVKLHALLGYGEAPV